MGARIMRGDQEKVGDIIMCNACGFFCCAWDGFEKCGCDHCIDPLCWSDDDDDEEVDYYGDETDE